ncbi:MULTISPECIES: VOC family protein [Vibrio]|uniref:VOC family protein n=1 Tax=Vibrio TaxID=662 RepID=UPI0005F21382|nr:MULTISPECIES: VOC family protein [Vibrio]MCA3913981.1 VOC family protein [Vibrio vulnificus]NVD07748.1 glyoxalase [Vibrio sp. JPW-9-11-11]
MALTPFHAAIPARDLEESRAFYKDVLNCQQGRSSECWVDFNLYGHQLVIHYDANIGTTGSVKLHHNTVDSHAVPVPHVGVVLEMSEWESLAQRLRGFGVEFVIEPYVRFKGQSGEQATLFFYDPSGNALEFKAFRDIEKQLFET